MSRRFSESNVKRDSIGRFAGGAGTTKGHAMPNARGKRGKGFSNPKGTRPAEARAKLRKNAASGRKLRAGQRQVLARKRSNLPDSRRIAS